MTRHSVRLETGPTPSTTQITLDNGQVVHGVTKAVLTIQPGIGCVLELELNGARVLAEVLPAEVLIDMETMLQEIEGPVGAVVGTKRHVDALLGHVRHAKQLVMREGSAEAPGPYIYLVLAHFAGIIHKTVDLEGGGNYSRDLYPLRALVVALDSHQPQANRVADMNAALRRHIEYPGVIEAHARTMMFNGRTLWEWCLDMEVPTGWRNSALVADAVYTNLTSTDGVQVFPESKGTWVAVGHGFVNLQESPAAFDARPTGAARAYREQYKPKPGWAEQVQDELAELLAKDAQP